MEATVEANNPAAASPFNPKALAIIFLAHLSGDFFQSFTIPMLALIKEGLGLNLTQVGFVISTVTVTGFLSQPLMGILADRFGTRTFLLIGLTSGAILIPLMSITPWYWALIGLAGLGAMGSAMYHPAAASMVGQFAGHRAGLSMSIFGLGGTMGYGLGPLVLTIYVTAFGLGNLPFLTIGGLAIIALMMITLPLDNRPLPSGSNILDGIKSGLGSAWKPVALLWLIGALRSFADYSIRTYYPIMQLERGESMVSMGLLLSMFVLGGSASAMVCGEFADRKGYKPLFWASFALSTPFLLVFLYCQGWWIYPAAFVAGFILLATMFPSVALANQLAPHNRGLVSSITLGFAVGSGGFMSPLAGQLAEIIGIQQTLVLISFVPLICLALIPFITIPDAAAKADTCDAA